MPNGWVFLVHGGVFSIRSPKAPSEETEQDEKEHCSMDVCLSMFLSNRGLTHGATHHNLVLA